MFRRILIPLDGSPAAEQALPLAKMLAKPFQSSVLLFQAVEAENKKGQDGAGSLAGEQLRRSQEKAAAYLDSIRRGFSEAAAVDAQAKIGPPADAIMNLADKTRVDLIVMATHGRSGLERLVYGSVANKIVTAARHPVLLVRAAEKPEPARPIKQILVPLDGSETAERALAPASELAAAFGAQVLLLRVVEFANAAVDGVALGAYTTTVDCAVRECVEEYLSQATRRLKLRGVHTQWEAPSGLVTDGILEAAQANSTDLIVMSSHGRSGVGGLILGSVAERVLRGSHRPVLVVRPSGPAK